MKAILLAAGKRTRFGELTKSTPKPVITVGGTPLIVHTLNALPGEVTECIVVIEYLGEHIRKELGSIYQARTITYVQQRYPGTGGALLSVREELKDEESFMVIGADNLFNKGELEKLFSFCPSYGVVRQPSSTKHQKREPVFDSSGYLTGLQEAQPDKPILCGAGAYVLTNGIFNEDFRSLCNGELSIPDTVAASST